MATLTASGVTFGDGTNMNGTTLLQVGMVAVLFNFSRSSVLPGSTAISSANLGYATSFTTAAVNGLASSSSAIRPGDVTVPGAAGSADSISASTSAVSGSWRMVSGARLSQYEGCNNYTIAPPVLAVRIA